MKKEKSHPQTAELTDTHTNTHKPHPEHGKHLAYAGLATITLVQRLRCYAGYLSQCSH